MGDILDDFLQIGKEFGAMKEDFVAAKDQIVAAIPGQENAATGHAVTQIFDPNRYLCEPSIDYRLCTHTAVAAAVAATVSVSETETLADLAGSKTAALVSAAAKSSCTACVEICPAHALSIQKGSVQLSSKDCTGCNLCVAVCPTEALVSSRLNAKELYDAVASAAAVKEASYATCANALAQTPPDGIVVLPCVGAVKAEVWFSLLAAYQSIAIYLPLDACEACVNRRGEELYCAAIEKAENWSGNTMGFECELSALKLNKRHEVERRELMNKLVRGAVTGAGAINPLAAGATKAYEAISKNTQLFDTVQSTLDRLCGTSQEEVVRTLTPARKLMLAALGAHKELASRIELELCETTDSCIACGACMSACPTGARVRLDGTVKTIASYCMGCGLCAEVCSTAGCRIQTTNGCVLVGETADLSTDVLSEEGQQ